MAGQLTIDTLKASSGVLATQNGMTGICKAWVNFNGYNGTSVRTSFNVSSVTRTAQGAYSLAFTTSTPDANYCPQITCTNNNDGTLNYGGAPYAVLLYNHRSTGIAPTTSGFSWSWTWGAAGYPDPTYVCVAVFGN